MFLNFLLSADPSPLSDLCGFWVCVFLFSCFGLVFLCVFVFFLPRVGDTFITNSMGEKKKKSDAGHSLQHKAESTNLNISVLSMKLKH